ncbi:MAG TPA: hypothetical protein VK190_04065 [Pseudoneobacillus sp.]|nr:hypothetical protein [Pseudoneobacillus sp.]
MGKFLMYLYLAIASYCLVNIYLSIREQAYQYTLLMVFLTFINLILFTVFRKEVKRHKIGSLQLVKQS